MHQRTQLGMSGQTWVEEQLVLRGFSILERNYKKPYGEIDLIAACNDLIAFVEVKTRMRHYMEPSALIPRSKQKKILITAQSFIAERNYIDKIYRFDVAFVEWGDCTPALDYIENAFTQ